MPKRSAQIIGLICAVLVFATPRLWADESFIQIRERSRAQPAMAHEAWVVDVDVTPFANHAGSVSIELDGWHHPIDLYDLEVRADGDLAWRGRFPDGGQAVLTLKNGFLVGALFTPTGVYELTTSPEGQIFQKLDPTKAAPCSHQETRSEKAPFRVTTVGTSSSTGIDLVPREGNSVSDPGGQQQELECEPAPSELWCGPQTPTIDLMVLYTPQARNGAGSSAAIEAVAQAAVDLSNTVFLNSEIGARFNLVHTAEAFYNDSGDISEDLNWLVGDPTVKSWRDQQSADFVSLLVENAPGFCGMAQLPGENQPLENLAEFFAQQVTRRVCSLGLLIFTHEHGHNFGANHDEPDPNDPDQPGLGPIRPYAYGHYYDNIYRTVMSVESCSGCELKPNFSNPNVLVQNLPTGIAHRRDNARLINELAMCVAGYRKPCTPETPACIVGPNTDLCQGAMETYYTSEVPFAKNYRWEVSTPWGFTQLTTDNEVTLSGHHFAPGFYTLRVRAETDCGHSAWRSANLIVRSNSDPACGGCIGGRVCF